jgi:Na+/glutamate symporter
MPDISQAVPLWFTFATIGIILSIVAGGIFWVKFKAKKLKNK